MSEDRLFNEDYDEYDDSFIRTSISILYECFMELLKDSYKVYNSIDTLPLEGWSLTPAKNSTYRNELIPLSMAIRDIKTDDEHYSFLDIVYGGVWFSPEFNNSNTYNPANITLDFIMMKTIDRNKLNSYEHIDIIPIFNKVAIDYENDIKFAAYVWKKLNKLLHKGGVYNVT